MSSDEMSERVGSESVAEQLAELQLLTRADHQCVEEQSIERRSSTPSKEGNISEGDEEAIESTGHSSFSALLAASRRLAGTTPPTSPSPTSQATSSVGSPRHALSTTTGTDLKTRRQTTMPTVCEDDADDSSTDDGPEPCPTCEGGRAHSSQPTVRRRRVPSRVYCYQDEEDACNDPVFEVMLHHIRHDFSFLALTATDITVSKLVRVRDALALSLPANLGDQRHDTSAVESPVAPMRLMRSIMAVDTMRMFLLRFDPDRVLSAVGGAVRQIFEKYVCEHGVEPLAHTSGVLTCHNIVRVVLLVRDKLEGQSVHHRTSDNNSEAKTPLCHDPSRRSPSKSPQSRTAPSVTSPGRSSSSGSVSYWDNSSPRMSPRRSILASEGSHVLLNEKLASFQHRNGDVERIPSFKVRRESGAAVDEAARRRQRSIQYGNEAVRARNMATFERVNVS